MAIIQLFSSAAQQRTAVERTREKLELAGHHPNPNALIAALSTDAERPHVVVIAVHENTPLADRVREALTAEPVITADTLFEHAARLLRERAATSVATSVAINMEELLQEAWKALTGHRKARLGELPGIRTLAACYARATYSEDEGEDAIERIRQTRLDARHTGKVLDEAAAAHRPGALAKAQRESQRLQGMRGELEQACRQVRRHVGDGNRADWSSQGLYERATDLVERIEKLLDKPYGGNKTDAS